MNIQAKLTRFAAAAILLGTTACQSSEPAPDYDGRNLYLGYCASCHGPTGAGDGPVAPAMATALPDLRTIAARKGEFPEDWVTEVIDGRSLRAAHGTPDMPVWGWQFRLVEDSEANARARIDALVAHIRELQQPAP